MSNQIKKQSIDKLLFGIILGFTLIFYIWMAAQIPYMHDDWDWGLDLGMNQLLHATLNSRYVGNFLVVVLTRCVWFKNIFMGLVLFLIPFMITKFNQTKNTFHNMICFITCNILFLTMETDMWRQTAGWVAGFSYFIVSLLLIIIYLLIIKELFSNETSVVTGWMYVPLFIFSVMIQLFIENVTCFILISSILALIISIVTHKNIAKYITILLGNIFGTIIMFSSNVYHSLATEGQALGGYRDFTFEKGAGLFNNIRSVSKTMTEAVIPNIWEKNWILCIAVALVMIFLIINTKKDTNKIQKSVFIVMNAIYLIYFVMAHINYHLHYQYDQPLPLWHSLINIGFFILVIIELIIFLHDKKENMPMAMVFWLSAPIIVAPLGLTSQNVAPRIYLTSSLFLTLFILWILKIELESCTVTIKKIMLLISTMIFFVLIIYYGIIYYQIGHVKDQRLDIIEHATQKKSTEIHLPSFPYEQYLWFPDPTVPDRVHYFKEFYGIDDSVSVIFHQ